MRLTNYFWKLLGIFSFIGLMIGAAFELFHVAWGTGNRIGQFSALWFFLFAGYCVFSLFVSGLLLHSLGENNFSVFITNKIIALRGRTRSFQLFLLACILLMPTCVFQFTIWGIVFQGAYIRLLTWALMIAAGTVLLTKGNEPASWNGFLSMLVLSGSVFSIFAALRFVTNYPFSLGWSEGNRLWDYSVMFGRSRYNYPPHENIFVLLETGRQFVGALPFLLPALSIKAARAWVALLTVFPYIFLGIVSFRSLSKKKILWMLLSLWTYLFLAQGPIHAPLLIGAVLVALAWGSPLWAAIPLLILSGYYIGISRFTWIFAPAIWIFILEITTLDYSTIKDFFRSPDLERAVLLALSSLVGSMVLPLFIPLQPTSMVSSAAQTPGILQLTQNLQENLTRQPLLWYRLLPNQTYGLGILLGALLVAAPAVGLLYYLIGQKHFIKNKLQLSLLILSGLAFLGMGLIVSTKIGGGGDLHNLDMFLIGLFFAAVLILTRGGSQWLENIHAEPMWIKAVIIFSLVLPALGPLRAMRSYGFIEEASTLLILTDSSDIKPLELYPPQDAIDDILITLQDDVDQALATGEVLFMDQRQLLTFGFITDAPLVPDYDKKVLMEQALASDETLFDEFYKDLQNKRFSLIIAQPQFTVEKGEENQFGEENNAWSKWVSTPLLCYYEVKKMPYKIRENFRANGMQLLVPKEETVDCADSVP